MSFENEQKFEYEFYTISYVAKPEKSEVVITLTDKQTGRAFDEIGNFLYSNEAMLSCSNMFSDELESLKQKLVNRWKVFKIESEGKDAKVQLWLHEFLHAVNKVEKNNV